VAYCQQHAIKPHIFSYYKKKFSAAPAAAKKEGEALASIGQ
jgi:hypothetical protein